MHVCVDAAPLVPISAVSPLVPISAVSPLVPISAVSLGPHSQHARSLTRGQLQARLGCACTAVARVLTAHTLATALTLPTGATAATAATGAIVAPGPRPRHRLLTLCADTARTRWRAGRAE